MGSLIAQGFVGAVLPALLALVLNGFVLRARALSENRKWALIGLIVVCGFVFSYSAAFGGIAFPPREATHWLPYTAIGSLLFGTVLMLTASAVRAIVRLVAAFGAAWTILQLQIFARWPFFFSLEWLVAITLFFFATSRLIERFDCSLWRADRRSNNPRRQAPEHTFIGARANCAVGYCPGFCRALFDRSAR
jgi:hypothetical protein